MKRSREIILERLKPAKEIYHPGMDLPVRIGADQHRLYKSVTPWDHPPKNDSPPEGKWHGFKLYMG